MIDTLHALAGPIDQWDKEPNRDITLVYFTDGRALKISGLEHARGELDNDWWNEQGEPRYGTWHLDDGNRIVDWTGWPQDA